MTKRCKQGQFGRFQFRLPVEIPRPDRVTKTQCGVRPMSIGRCGPGLAPAAMLAARARTVTGGLTSPARPVTGGGVRKTTSGVLNTVSPFQVWPADAPSRHEQVPTIRKDCFPVSERSEWKARITQAFRIRPASRPDPLQGSPIWHWKSVDDRCCAGRLGGRQVRVWNLDCIVQRFCGPCTTKPVVTMKFPVSRATSPHQGCRNWTNEDCPRGWGLCVST
jgi:hypothetical protein